ncbi:MAG TPA: DUF2914 domain-containing protein [Vicinamibacterales bacterium]|nr:DUF2914 domain-containing protein [Vicinamibacterales bacterium]
MQAAPELRSIVEKAEQAAAGGDHAQAERLLREALKLQETTVGAQHPDLANTLNNLGVVCEMSGKPADAEQCYRRAYEIVSARLPADHPFIATSRKNLEDFCNARGIPVERTVPAIPFPPEAPPVVTAPSRKPAAPVPAVVYTPVPARRSFRGFVIAGLLVGALAFGIFYAMRPRVGTSVDTRPSSSSAASPQQVSPSPSPSPSPPPTAEPKPAPAAAATTAPTPAPVPTPVAPPVAPAQTPIARTDTPAAPAVADTRPPAARGPAPTVVSAQLCLNPPGSAWSCDAVSGSVDSRTLFFYTRVASGNDTTIQHRWYQGDRLQQTIELRVRANPAGFRTYSRKTVARDLLGDWRVELRAEDGSVLSEERFVVR